MTYCDVIRDLLPLYADDACSQASRGLVEEHLRDCPDCREQLRLLRETEIEESLADERDSVIQNGIRAFRRRSALVGSAISGTVAVPALIVLLLVLVKGPGLSWVSIVLAAVLVAASLIAVPLLVPEEKFFWTVCAFTASLLFLLGIVCLYTHGNWFRVSASAVLFGMCLIFLPFLLKAGPFRDRLQKRERWLIVLGTDLALFFNMLGSIQSQGKISWGGLLFDLGIFCGVGLVAFALIRKIAARRP